MKWSKLKRLLLPKGPGPPAVIVDDDGVTLWLGGKAHSRILWSQLTSVDIGIVTAPEMDYSEAFWGLTGDGAEVIVPVEVIVNAGQLNSKLFKLPGFDMEMYHRAREAESQGLPGEFVCWRKSNA
ncbi:MAG TPA: hypothetical protein VIQ24_01155 [Pyrinomonadaceae bacterium]